MRTPATGLQTHATRDHEVVHLLLLDDPSHRTEALLNALREGGYGIRPGYAADADALVKALTERRWDLVLSPPVVGDLDVARVHALLQRNDQDAALLVVADELTEEALIGHLCDGADDVVARLASDHLRLAARRELEHLHAAREVQHWKERAREAESRCVALLESSRDAVAYVHDGMHVYANPNYLRIFGYASMEGLEELPLLDLVIPQDADRLRLMMRKLSSQDVHDVVAEVHCGGLDGNPVRVNMQLTRARYDGENCLQVLAQDLSDRERFEQQLRFMSQRDPLTGLFNHRHFREQLESLAGEVAAHGVSSALLLVEIENFDAIRKTVGIALSDNIVRDLAAVIRGCIREGDVLARIGDQCFAVLLSRRSVGTSDQIAETIRKAVADHIWNHDEHSVATTCSVGIAPINPAGHDPDDVIARADNAVHRALAGGGNRIEVSGSEPRPPAHVDDEDALRADSVLSALDEERATLLFQPIVNLHGKTEEIYEVRVALYDETGSAYSTTRAFEQVEASGEASRLDLWVLSEVLNELRQQRERGREVRFFMKLSQQSMRDEATLLAIARAIRSSGVQAASLTFEIDHEVASGQVKYARAMVSVLRELGCRTALSRFGNGLNSFNVLNHVDVDYLKIDPAVIESVTDTPQAEQALRQLQERARALGKETIATAVQDANTLALLWQCGVRYAQGHYIQEPNRELSYEFTDT